MIFDESLRINLNSFFGVKKVTLTISPILIILGCHLCYGPIRRQGKEENFCDI